MAFWAVEVKAGKPAVYVPPPEQARLKLSQATLSLDASPNERAALRCRVEGNDEVLICSLREGSQETTNLDLVLDRYTEFSLETKSSSSKGSIHLAGYLVAEIEDEEGIVEDSDESPAGLPEGVDHLTPQQLQAIMDGEDDSEGSDYDDDDSEEEDDDDDEDDEEGSPTKSSVIIEDITDQEEAKLPNGRHITMTTAVVKETVVPSKNEKAKQKSEEEVKAAIKEAEDFLATMPPGNDDEEEEASEDEDDEELNSEGSDSQEEEEDSEAEEEDEEEKPVITGKEKKIAAKLAKAATQAAKKQGEKRKAPEQADKSSDLASAQREGAEKKGKKAKTATEAQKAVAAPKPTSEDKPMKGKRTYPNGFIIENVSIRDPAGKLAKAGKRVSVKYVGKLQKSGKIFDQTKGNKPFSFRLGVNEVIKGWDQGVVGMRVGDKRKLTIPPQMAYGAKGIPNVIPGNSTLLFDVELVDVK